VKVADPQIASWRTTLFAGALAALLASPFCFNAIQDADLGWHVAVGRLIRTQGIPHANVLTWTEPKTPWYATSWLFDVLTERLEHALGPTGIQAFTCALLLLSLAGVLVACRRLDRHGPWLVPATALLLIPRVMPRPHMLSWVVLAWVMACGVLGRERSWGWRLLCVPIIVFGSNGHSGAIFALGALGLFCVEAAWRERAWGREILIGLGGALALVANPGGLYNVLYAFGNLSVYKQLPIEEMKPPAPSDLPAFFVMIPIALIAGFVQRRKRPVMLPLALVFAGLGLFAVRLAFEFYLVAVPVLAGSLEYLRAQVDERGEKLAFGLLITLATATMISRAAHLSPRLAWDESVLPVRAARFIATERLSGPHFNSFEDGGYLEYALPALPAFQDGRVQAFPPAFFADEIAASEDPGKFDRYLRSIGAEWAITTSSTHGLSGNGLIQGLEWGLVYWDDVSEIYLRRDLPRFAETLARDEFRYFVPTTSPAALVSAAATLPIDELRRLAHEAERFDQVRPGEATTRLTLCAARTRLKEAAASSFCASAHAQSDDAEWQGLVKAAESLR
jgi:hypothetical protein